MRDGKKHFWHAEELSDGGGMSDHQNQGHRGRLHSISHDYEETSRTQIRKNQEKAEEKRRWEKTRKIQRMDEDEDKTDKV